MNEVDVNLERNETKVKAVCEVKSDLLTASDLKSQIKYYYNPFK